MPEDELRKSALESLHKANLFLHGDPQGRLIEVAIDAVRNYPHPIDFDIYRLCSRVSTNSSYDFVKAQVEHIKKACAIDEKEHTRPRGFSRY